MMAIRPSERISGNSLAFLSAAGVAAAVADATNTGRPVVLALAAVVAVLPSQRPPSYPSIRFVTLSSTADTAIATHPNRLLFNDFT